jgi:DNA-binding transcriptional LysR family regulator
MQLELRHLRYFLAVAEELNFSRAAERLHIAQPALSAQIRSLETQAGCELFARTTRKVELTPAGKLLLEDARDIVARADEAAAKLVAAARGRRGLVRICFVAHGAGETQTEILRRAGIELAEIETELVESGSLEETQRQVRDYETDLGFIWRPVLYDELATKTLCAERKLACMHVEHRLAAKPAVVADDLLTEPIVAPWDLYSDEMLDYWFTPFRPKGRRPDDPHARSIEECLSLVVRRAAIFCVPESVQRFFPRPEIVFRPIIDVAPAEVALAWHRDVRNPAVLPFVEIAKAVVDEGGVEPIAIQRRSS